MKILVSNHAMDSLGGSETFAYTLAVEMKRKGHEVHMLTPRPGFVSERLRTEYEIGINEIDPEYDLCLLSHNTTIDWVIKNMVTQDRSKIIQTCHGYMPPLEQPHPEALDIRFASISEEVKTYLETKNLKSSIIRNGIDLERFNADSSSSMFTKIYSLSQSDPFNEMLAKVAKYFGVNISYNNKCTNPIWSIEDEMRDSQIVFGLGRSAYEGLAMGKCVFAADARSYMGGRMDGIINEANISDFVRNNCSGRNRNLQPTYENIINEIKNNYLEADSIDSRKIAEEYFDIKKQSQKYIDLVK